MSLDARIRHAFGTQSEPKGHLHPEEWERLRPRWKQVHGIAVARVTAPEEECGEVDALWTSERSLPIAVVTADCVPILLERHDRSAVAAIHAGWRGTHAGIIEAFFQALPKEFADPALWSARIGPCIQACCYEVSEDLMDSFVGRFSGRFFGLDRRQIEPAWRKLDLVAVNHAVLSGLGVNVREIHPDCTHCTKQGEGFRYFSYRRGDRNSRQFSVISIEQLPTAPFDCAL